MTDTIDKDDHRTPLTLEISQHSNEERIRYVRVKKWIRYPAAQEILKDLKAVLEHPRQSRMPCRLIVANTNNGKTDLLNHFRQMHPPSPNVDGEAIHLPVLAIEAAGPFEKGLYIDMLDRLFEKFPIRASTQDLQRQLITVLKRVQPGMILIDEFNTLGNGTAIKTHDCLNGLKHITNETNVPIVGAGTIEALSVASRDKQIENRFEPRHLPLWKNGRELKQLLAGFASMLPLRKPSYLHKLSGNFIERSDGTIGELSKFIQAAAIHAIETGTEQIDDKVLKACSYRSPAERLIHARGTASQKKPSNVVD